MSERPPPAAASYTRDEEADAVLAACRVLVAMSAQSIAAVEDVADRDPGARAGGDRQPRVGVAGRTGRARRTFT